MSVVVHPDYQRQGIANTMLKNFIAHTKGLKKTEIQLMCETALIALYASHGFIERGISDSNYAGLNWHEMSLTL
jgi:ribosomal protein S18 acetylase RimI-like enzyme